MSDWPQYGLHYRAGYFGFSRSRTFVSNGIATATAGDVKTGFSWSHVFIVESERTILEATSPRVCGSDLSKYTGRSDTQVAFRRPRFWSEQFAADLIAECEPDLGKFYDTPLLVGHLINKLTAGILRKQVARLFDNPNRFICSEWAAAKLLAVRPGWANLPKSVLRRPPNTINPQEFFEDTAIWDLWADAVDARTL